MGTCPTTQSAARGDRQWFGAGANLPTARLPTTATFLCLGWAGMTVSRVFVLRCFVGACSSSRQKLWIQVLLFVMRMRGNERMGWRFAKAGTSGTLEASGGQPRLSVRASLVAHTFGLCTCLCFRLLTRRGVHSRVPKSGFPQRGCACRLRHPSIIWASCTYFL
jgi:hypothetical protein